AAFVVVALLTLPLHGLARRSTVLLATLFTAFLFFLPVWFSNGLSFDWFTAIPPDEQGVFGLLARFLYKTVMAVGLLQVLLLLLLALPRLRLRSISTRALAPKVTVPWEMLFPVAVILVNLAIFFRMPVEFSYLQPALVCFYFLLARHLPSNLFPALLVVALLNVGGWFFKADLIAIEHRYPEGCGPVQAIGARFQPSITPTRRFRQMFADSAVPQCGPGPGISASRAYFGNVKGLDFSDAFERGLPLRNGAHPTRQ
ncbi:MAG: hypothetical protein VKI81_00385, partial [Synechococcaceae cyanobacterium]|nr:hypothetical protein [Synechococcaceae cyanobacterium]